jgi:signal transduction histidine kinase
MTRRSLKIKLAGLGNGFLVFFCGVLCLHSHHQDSLSSIIWLPTAIGLTSLFLVSLDIWPWILAGELALYTWAHFPVPVILLVSLGTTGIQFFSARYLRARLGTQVTFARLNDLVIYFVVACIALPVSVSLITVFAHTAFGTLRADQFLTTWRSWLCGQSVGLLVLGPFAINWKNDSEHRRPLLAKRKWEAGLLFTLILSTCIFIFTPYSRFNHTLLIKPYFLFSMMLWASLRFDLLGSTITSVVIVFTAIAGSFGGFEIFSTLVSDPKDGSLMLQFMIGAITVTGMVVAATVREKSEALAARNEFLDIASHELKTPITSLKLQLQLIQRRLQQKTELTESDSQNIVFLSKVDRQVIRLVKIVEQLLDVSRAERNLLHLEREEINLNDLIQLLADRFSSELIHAKSSLQINLPAEVKGYWDPFRMEQVLENLISNALKYAPGTPIQVIGENKGDYLELLVKDGGPGIPSEKQHTIFDRFVRASETRYVQGLGLGLFITRRILEAHGGSIKVKSEKGVGTTFILTLPYKSNL